MSFTETVVEQKSVHLLLKAIHFGASDLHLMPNKNDYLLYFRKYGQLVSAGQLPLELGDRMISYFKFLSSLDISDKRRPQSGSFQQVLNEQSIAFRVSTLPSVFIRESLVIRIMLQDHAIPLSSLSFFKESANHLLKLVKKRQGILFFTGPTGCGKSTSLYSLIHYCSNELKKHVISLEDPVENNQSNLLQIQVNERAGVTYASGLKAILRHSPDIIMIGEIRDQETAKIAIEAALTGHLVLTTIHSRDTFGCLFRLLDLGVSLEELRQTVIGVVAQRLVKKAIAQDEEKFAAIYEILADGNLAKAVEHVKSGQNFTLPFELSLEGQMKEGVRLGAITAQVSTV
ncbi:Flp pilus assembly complex ATPase component TadA [Viridibacillus sp. YIM B01967]|uniref:Flp pilus assembly complex ATPase component TadA n=1 Tax=Viridibacillus soli TaxID=2798301 RepID=A0ABS1H3M5_9BACL|nr:competence type IV pilus ATPase ComGA [Viridibacillus soli]MBK3494006.1 Flp pilus assembly complex ATPase component TadA [Viridibacillus soli]